MINNYNPVTMGGVLPPYWDSALIHKDVSGSIASFSDGADGLPLKSCVVQIEPVQSGSGDPSPDNIRPITGWAKANIGNATQFNYMLPLSEAPTTQYGVTCEYLGAGKYRIHGTSTSNLYHKKIVTQGFVIPDGTGKLCEFNNSAAIGKVQFLDNNNSVDEWNLTKINLSSSGYIKMAGQYTDGFRFAVPDGLTVDYTLQILFTKNKTTFPITFPSSTVYGGTVTLNPDGSADIISTMGNIASYDGETLTGAWISSMDVYEEGATPTTGAQIVYELETPQTYHIDNVGNLQTLLGANNIWADTGDISLTYYADATLAHEAQTAELQALILEQ